VENFLYLKSLSNILLFVKDNNILILSMYFKFAEDFIILSKQDNNEIRISLRI
jgi:hypothetical protein